jgi:hypothetical protein
VGGGILVDQAAAFLVAVVVVVVVSMVVVCITVPCVPVYICGAWTGRGTFSMRHDPARAFSDSDRRLL